MTLRQLAPIIAILCTLLAAPTFAAAQSGQDVDRFTISPEPAADPAVTERGYFVYELKPGTRAAGRVLVANTGQEDVTVELAAVDAMTAQTGGSAFAPTDTEPAAAGAWVDLAEPRVTLERGQRRAIDFTVRLPAGVEPGQYLAGIAAYVPTKPGEAAVRGENEAGATLDVQTRYVIAVQVDVPGKQTPHLTISGVELLEQPSGAMLSVALRNDGDIFLKPTGTVTVTAEGGGRAFSRPIRMDTFVTGTEVAYPVPWPGGPKPGQYGVDIELDYAEGKTATYAGTVEVGTETAAGTVLDLTLNEVRDPENDGLRYVEGRVSIENPGAPVENARLTLRVTHDGRAVEDYPLGSSVSVPSGASEFHVRYLPATDWSPGTYTFVVTLEAVDPANQEATALATSKVVTISVEERAAGDRGAA